MADIRVTLVSNIILHNPRVDRGRVEAQIQSPSVMFLPAQQVSPQHQGPSVPADDAMPAVAGGR